MQKTEIEYTFLARAVPEEILGVQPVRMEDTYFPEDLSVHAQLRVRRKDDSYVITKKVPVLEGDASTQVETSIRITRAEYESISSGSRRKIVKDRYRVIIDGYPAEVDIFKGVLQGLVLIDFEFNSQEERGRFVPPAVYWFEASYSNPLSYGRMLLNRLPNISQLANWPLVLLFWAFGGISSGYGLQISQASHPPAQQKVIVTTY